MHSLKELKNFIGGDFAAASDGKWRELLNPATGLISRKAADSDHIDIVLAVQAGNKALPAWAKLETEGRIEFLTKFLEALQVKREDIAKAQSEETGMPIASSRLNVARGLEAFAAGLKMVSLKTENGVNSEHAQFMTYQHPIGLVAIIASWSDVAFFLLSRLATALLSGNAVIVKPSSYTPETAVLIAEACREAGLPAGVFNVVQGRGTEIGELLVEHPGVHAISFSGRTETGKEIQRKAAEFLKRTQLSLSGCNSALVFAENDLEKTAPKVARLCFSQNLPLKASRLFIQESVYERFRELLKSEISKLEAGDPLAEKTHMGPLIDARAVSRHEAWIDQALSEKGKLLFGGKGTPAGLSSEFQSGFFIQPTAVYDLTLCSTLQQEEPSGPTCLISSFKYQHDAVKYANTSPFGLAAYLFHSNAAKVSRIARKIEAGRVFINPSEQLWDPRLQRYGGLKNSGIGQEGVLDSLRFFSKEVVIGQDLSD